MTKPIKPISLRAGTTLFEVVVAVTLLGAGLVMTGQVLYTTSHLRREDQRRQRACQEAANALEQLRSMPWSELTAAEPPQMGLSPEGSAQLPHGKLTLQIKDEERELPAKQLVVEVAWQQPSGQPASPVRLSSWRFSVEGSP